MSSPYQNAQHVLPPGLLAEVQRHASGHLWVPAAASHAVRTRQRVIQLHQAGICTREIAELVGISQRRVQQIVRTVARGNARHAE